MGTSRTPAHATQKEKTREEKKEWTRLHAGIDVVQILSSGVMQ